MFIRRTQSSARGVVRFVAPAALASALCLAQTAGAQSLINAGTEITVRTTEAIDARSHDGRVFTAVVDRNVPNSNGQRAIPRGSQVELLVREVNGGDLILDLDSVVVHGERYGIRAEPTRLDTPGDSHDNGRHTATYAGGGALLGTIIGAIAGGGKGAAIGAATGAAAGIGAGVLTHGHEVRVPADSLLTFRLDRPLEVGVPDRGMDRDHRHYHPAADYPGSR